MMTVDIEYIYWKYDKILEPISLILPEVSNVMEKPFEMW